MVKNSVAIIWSVVLIRYWNYGSAYGQVPRCLRNIIRKFKLNKNSPYPGIKDDDEQEVNKTEAPSHRTNRNGSVVFVVDEDGNGSDNWANAIESSKMKDMKKSQSENKENDWKTCLYIVDKLLFIINIAVDILFVFLTTIIPYSYSR